MTRYCASPGCEADISSRAPQARYCSNACYQASYYAARHPKVRPTRYCAHCEADISPRSPRARYCSKACYYAAGHPRAESPRYCARPGCEADISSRMPHALYCSKACSQASYAARHPQAQAQARARYYARHPRAKSRAESPRYCARCGADISSRVPQARYCSSPCRQAGYRSRGWPVIKGQPAVIPFEVLSLSDLAVRLYGWISARYDGLLYATPPSAGTLARELGRPRAARSCRPSPS